MKKDVLDFKSDKLFPWQFQLLGVVILIGGLGAITSILYLTPVLIALALLIFTAHRGIEFDSIKKTYRVYNSFIFIKTGKSLNYEVVEKIYINLSKVSQKIYTRANLGTTFKNQEYDAYLKFDNSQKIFLLNGKDKEEVMSKLKSLSNFFQLEVIDNTE
jgi:hypothetical protein